MSSQALNTAVALPDCFYSPCCSDAVSIEVLTRQLANEGGPDALLSLCPWLEFVTIPTQVGGLRQRQPRVVVQGFSSQSGCTATQTACIYRGGMHPENVVPQVLQWEGQWAETLLSSLYSITAQQADRQAYEVCGVGSRLQPACSNTGQCSCASPALCKCGRLQLLAMLLAVDARLGNCRTSAPAAAEDVGHPGSQPPQHGASPQLFDGQGAEGGRSRQPRRRRHRQGGGQLLPSMGALLSLYSSCPDRSDGSLTGLSSAEVQRFPPTHLTCCACCCCWPPQPCQAQVVLYLSRVAAKQTIGHLVHEVLQQIAQPDPPEAELAEAGSPYAAGTPDGGTPKASRGGSGVWCLQRREAGLGAALQHSSALPSCTQLSAD